MFFFRPLVTVTVLVLLTTAPLSAQNPADPSRWEKDIQAFEQWDARNSLPEQPVLFIGSSSIRLWPTRKSFEKLPVVNRGFGGSTTPDILHYFDRLVPPYAPRAIVFYCGDNDVASGRTPEQVRDDFAEFARRVHAKFPKARVLHLPIKPSIKRWNLWPVMKDANDRIAEHCRSDPRLEQVDVATPMLGDDGKPRPELFVADGLHLSPEGYAVWTEKLLPRLEAADRE